MEFCLSLQCRGQEEHERGSRRAWGLPREAQIAPSPPPPPGTLVWWPAKLKAQLSTLTHQGA